MASTSNISSEKGYNPVLCDPSNLYMIGYGIVASFTNQTARLQTLFDIIFY